MRRQTQAIFILSLDCEGKWGLADQISDHHARYFTSENLRRAYCDLLALFEKWELPATFAFVMAFILAKEELGRYADLFQDGGRGGWLRHFRRDAAAQRFDGWFVPEALEMVQAADRHEIGCHGFSHLPLAEDLAGEGEVRHELAAAMAVARAKDIAPKTFVYPRNLVGHTRLLQEHGFVGYRTRPPGSSGKLRRVRSALGNFDLFTPSQPPARPAAGAITPIPSGYFLHWRHGVRRAVPPPLTVMRWRHILAHAVRHGGVAHLHLHPHNIIDGPGTLRTLDQILAVVARHRDRGDLETMTQESYCTHVGASLISPWPASDPGEVPTSPPVQPL
jgi:peptidoglycan/xylan/chitin deacetylase (PgdA/CDA1 family)